MYLTYLTYMHNFELFKRIIFHIEVLYIHHTVDRRRRKALTQ